SLQWQSVGYKKPVVKPLAQTSSARFCAGRHAATISQPPLSNMLMEIFRTNFEKNYRAFPGMENAIFLRKSSLQRAPCRAIRGEIESFSTRSATHSLTRPRSAQLGG